MKKTFLTLSISILLLSACQEQAPNEKLAEPLNLPEAKISEELSTMEEVKPIVFTWPFTFDEEAPELQIQIDEGCKKYYDQDGISFNYPCDWELNPEGWNTTATLLVHRDHTPPGTTVSLELPAESFADYEEEFKNVIESPDDMGMSVEEKQLMIGDKTYPIKEYGQHHGLTYIVEIEGEYIKFGSDTVLSEKELEGVYIILSSIKF